MNMFHSVPGVPLENGTPCGRGTSCLHQRQRTNFSVQKNLFHLFHLFRVSKTSLIKVRFRLNFA